MIRAQYYLRQSDEGVLAWDVRRLVELSRDLPVQPVDLSQVKELNETYWYDQEGDTPTCRSILQHMQLIDDASLDYPIILDQHGRVMDGMHRVCKAVREDRSAVPAVRFAVTPEPCFVDCDPAELPYDD